MIDMVSFEVLRQLIDFQRKVDQQKSRVFKGAWEYQEVKDLLKPWELNDLLQRGFIIRVYESNRYRAYKVNVDKVSEYLSRFEKPKMEKLEIPEDLFDVIEGFDDIKEFIKMSLRAKDPVHVLLVGPTGTAKSLFLMELERLGGYFITAGTTTKVGLRDLIYEELPRILIIDELDKCNNPKDISALLTWMDYGRIVVTKHGLRDVRHGKGWVFAAANRVDNLPPELLDRFRVFQIRKYSRDQFIKVATNFLVKRLHVDLELARYIAVEVSKYDISVRAARDIARIAQNKEQVKKAINTLRRYKLKHF